MVAGVRHDLSLFRKIFSLNIKEVVEYLKPRWQFFYVTNAPEYVMFVVSKNPCPFEPHEGYNIMVLSGWVVGGGRVDGS
jgi:hypothetical protein